ncbi:MAG: hypothetical protein KF708_00080 [Pirellulales bacterium]|nr:hypothetical protein [Pirellulales bacterium]
MRGITAVACVALALGWAASAQAQVVVPYQVFSPVVETVTPVPVWQPGVVEQTFVQPTVVQSPVVVPTTTFFAPQPTVTFLPPQPVTVMSPAPTMVFRPAPVVVSPAPVFVGRPVVVRPRVFVPGQPVRNVLRAAW